MRFMICVYGDGKSYRFNVSLVSTTNQVEKYQVAGRNRSITLQSNRPLLRARGMKTRRPDWKLIDGTMYNASFLEAIVNTLESTLSGWKRSIEVPCWTLGPDTW